jgi:uncharacterized C2H2 Zn-finger protein
LVKDVTARHPMFSSDKMLKFCHLLKLMSSEMKHLRLLKMPEFSGFEVQYVDEFRPEMVFLREDGRFECTLCGNILCAMSVARTHVIRMHTTPEYFKCSICEATIKHRQAFSNHINKMHHITGGRDYVKMYGRKV